MKKVVLDMAHATFQKKEMSHHKHRLVWFYFLQILVTGMLFFGAGNDIAQAASQPPQECTLTRDRVIKPGFDKILGVPVAPKIDVYSIDSFECTGTEPQGVKFPHKNQGCANFCRDGGGLVLQYQESLQSTCFGIEEARACEVTGGQWTNLATGEAITKKQAETINPESCDPLDISCWTRNLIKKIANVGATILDSVVRIIAGGVQVLAALLQEAMARVIDYFMSQPISPSNDSAPEFVKQAWNFTRGFANNFFILILAFIGLATILRLQAYQLQKTLPALLLVALLVNFSGVLVGLVADVGNIITSNFLLLAKGAVWSDINFIPSFDVNKGVQNLALDIVRIIYYAISSLIFLGVMIAFGLRTIVLWTLAIVSPLAFAAYILPATRKFFNDWWKQLIQWSLFGIPLSFFLFLASMTLKAGAVPSGPTVGVLANFFAPFTTLFLLFTGITMSMAMAPAGAQSIIGGAKKVAKKWGGAGGLAVGAQAWRKFGQRFETKAKNARIGAEKTAAETGKKGLGYWATMAVARPMEGLGGEATRRMKARDERRVAERETAMLNKDSMDLVRIFNREQAKGSLARDNATQIAAIHAMIKNKDQDDLQEYIKDGTLNGSRVGEIVRLAGEQLGPPGYRPMAKALSGFIYQEPELLGWSKNPNQKLFGNMTLEKLAKEIPEKLTAGEISEGMLGNFLKRMDDPEWAKYGKPLAERLFERPELFGAMARKPESLAGRKMLAETAQNYLNARTPDEILQQGLLPVVRFMYSDVAAGTGIAGGYKDRMDYAEALEKDFQPAMERQKARPQGGPPPLRTPDTIQNELNELSTQLNQMSAAEQQLQPELQGLQARARLASTSAYDHRRISQVRQQLSNLSTRRQQVTAREAEVRKEQLQESPGPIGRVYQQWTGHLQQATQLQTALQDIENRIVQVKDANQREQALKQFYEIGTLAQGEQKIARDMGQRIADLSKDISGLSRAERAEEIKEARLDSKHGSALRQAQRKYQKLTEDLYRTEEQQKKEGSAP